MPTLNPRITITLDPVVHERLKRLSELSGNSQSSFVSELVLGSLPVVNRLITLMEAAKDVRAELSDGLVADLEAAQSRVEAQLGLGLEDFDRFNVAVLKEADTIKRRSGRAAMRKRGGAVAAAPPTPISNRGVRSTTKPPRRVP